jgi:hypothetical protein
MWTQSWNRAVLATTAAVLIALALAACGQRSGNPMATLNRGLVEMIDALETMAEMLEGVTDESSANAAARRMQRELLPRVCSANGDVIAAVRSLAGLDEAAIRSLALEAASEGEIVWSGLLERFDGANYISIIAIDSMRARRTQLVTSRLETAFAEFEAVRESSRGEMAAEQRAWRTMEEVLYTM